MIPPAAPRIAPIVMDSACEPARAAPHNAPKTMRAIRPTGAVRAGAFGSLSAISSTTAPTVKTATAASEPRKWTRVWPRSIQPRCAAQATTAGAVRERKPQTTPIKNARTRTRVGVMEISFAYEIAERVGSYFSRFDVHSGSEGSMHRTLVRDLHQPGFLFFRQRACEMNFPLDAVQLASTRFAVGAIGGVDFRVPQMNGDVLKRPGLAASVHRHGHGRARAQSGEQQIVRSWPGIGAARGHRLVRVKTVRAGMNFLSEPRG